MWSRNFAWCREEVANFCLRDDSHVHICITGPEGRPIRPQCGKKHINLFFHDLNPARIRLSPRYQEDPAKGEEIIATCFKESQAVEIVRFVRASKPDETIVVNCAAGISRSPGVVLAFERFMGRNTDYIFERAEPNPHVTAVLTKVLGETNAANGH